MRIRICDGCYFSHARMGRDVALPSINIQEGSPRLHNLLGLALHKTNHTDNRRG